ncbi:hypothetical protein [Thiomicrorhabdus sp. 6S3-12]|uniref:hypothetical protein n=1 Tax=Thiomicrorhabdus sp. 6S3-12 TaxID=2819681 RepID=UPI001AACBC46|nr:hypothetical protein [Thiomicrorhabdus sp. 6S3-12]MBO1924577.1 hypothetical protein [Thiomicrorhabdus sp. 6S3-12]
MRDDTLMIRQLTNGQVLCSVTAPDAVAYLKTEIGRESVDDALHYQGMTLAHSEYQDYWYAVYNDLNFKPDASAIRRELQHVFNTTEPFLSFMKLVMEASGEDQYPDIEHDFYFGSVLSTIENNDTLANDLVKLTSKAFFKKASNRSTHSERLRTVVDLMESEGIIISDDSGSHYTYTGKLAYHIALVERVLEIQVPELLDDVEDEQGSLELA